KEFTAMLSYRACVYITKVIDPILVFHTLHSHVSRSLIEWILYFVTIGGLIFITQLVVAKVGDLAASLISISGESGGGGSSFGLAGAMMGEGFKLGYAGARKSLGAGLSAVSYGVKHGGKIARHIPGVKQIGQAFSYLGNSIENTTGVSWRNSIIDSTISQAQKEAKDRGLKGVSQDRFVRERSHELLRNRALSSDKANPKLPFGQGTSMRFAGVNTKEINKRLDKKLIDDPLRDVIKKEAKKLKSQYGEDIPLGEDMRKALRAKAEDWAKNNLHYHNEEDVKSRLQNMKGFIKDSGELTSSEAAERFSGDKSMQDRYLQHLRESEHRRAKKADEAWEKGSLSGAANWMSRALHNVTRDVRHNPKMAQENFLQQSQREKEQRDGTRTWGGYLSSRLNLFDKTLNYDSLSKQTASAKRDATLSYLRSGGGAKAKAFHDLMRREAREADANELARIRRLDAEGVAGSMGRGAGYARSSYDEIKKESQQRKRALLKSVREGLDANDGRTLLERAARLSQLNRNFGIERDPLKDISKALQEKSKDAADQIKSDLIDGSITQEAAEIRMKELREKDFSIYAQDSSALDSKLSESFAENLKELEDKIDGKLAKEEKTDKVREKDEASDDEALKAQEDAKTKLEETSKDLQSIDVADRLSSAEDGVQRFDEASKAAESHLASGDVDKAREELEKAQKEAPIIVNKMEVEFGSNISDALIKGGDVTIKGGNVMIGGDKVGKKSDIDENLLNSLKLEKTQCDGRLKMANLDKKIKEFELKQLKDKSDSDPKAIDRLEKEITDLEKEHNRLKTESSRLETGISSLRSAMS
ncbi:MAG: hypothetical protein GY909_09990, partial [Oligoflexia bacterium]|nr:hypothetical protein [Oligoflexia bacterium]